MASTSQAAHGLSVEQVQGVELTNFGPESACDSAVSSRMHAVPANAVATAVWMESDEEDALAAGELAMVIQICLTWYRVSLCALCRRLRASAGL